jgi:D-xylose transport system substrate-binding protein
MSNWHVHHPRVIVGHGAATDNNATLFAQGYYKVINPYFASHKWVKTAALAGTWDGPTSATEFEGAYAASNPKANAVLMPNDNTDNAVITYLKNSVHVKPYSFPSTGQDASFIGIQNVISGYQCGTVYKPIYVEAQAAATLALFVRAKIAPPASFVNDSVKDTNEGVSVPSVLLQTLWVTPTKVQQTVIKDGAVKASDVCTSAYKADCREYHIH